MITGGTDMFAATTPEDLATAVSTKINGYADHSDT
jgi:hypothetical protein